MPETAATKIIGDCASDCFSKETGGKGSPMCETEDVPSDWCTDTVAYLTKDTFAS